MSGDAIRSYETAFDTMQKIKTVWVSETIYLLAWLWQSQTGRTNTEKNNGCFGGDWLNIRRVKMFKMSLNPSSGTVKYRR